MRSERQGCFALTGPKAGWDPGSMTTRAVKDGVGWIINSEKRFITSGSYSDYAVVFAKAIVDGEENGVTTFRVDTDIEGWNVHWRIDMMRPKDPFEIHLDDVQIPDENRFGEVGEGHKITVSGVRSSRIGYFAANIGIAKYVLKTGIEYVKDRETFGKPLSERQAIRWMIADSAVDIHTSRLALYDCAWKADQGIGMRHEVSIVKLQAAEMLQEILDRVIQMHGVVGVSKDLSLER